MAADYSQLQPQANVDNSEWHPLAVGMDFLENEIFKKDLDVPIKNEPAIKNVDWNKIIFPKTRALVNTRSFYVENKVFGACSHITKSYNHYYQLLGIKGAAENSTTTRISVSDIKEMIDPYDSTTRKDFSEIALNNAIIAPGLERRSQALYEDDFELFLEEKDAETQEESETSGTGQELSKAQQQSQGNIETEAVQKTIAPELENKFAESFKQLKSWTKEKSINLLRQMKTANHISIVQGRHCVNIFPPISQLQENKLPDILKTISPEDMKHPLVDTKLTWSMVALRVELGSKQFLLPDEMVYITRRDDGLRKDSAYYGASTLEPIITAGRTFNRILNHNIPKIAIAAWMQKLIIQVMTRGGEAEQLAQLTAFANGILSKQNDILCLNAGTIATAVPIKIETDAIKFAYDNLIDVICLNIGVTKSMIFRENNLTRDIATVQEIAFIKYIRKPDEKIIAEAFETQLLNPLLAHLEGVTVDELPVRVRIRRIEEKKSAFEAKQEDKNVTDQQNLQDNKEKDMKDGDMKQKDAKTPIVGASQPIQIIKQTPATEKEIELMEKDIALKEKLLEKLETE